MEVWLNCRMVDETIIELALFGRLVQALLGLTTYHAEWAVHGGAPRRIDRFWH